MALCAQDFAQGRLATDQQLLRVEKGPYLLLAVLFTFVVLSHGVPRLLLVGLFHTAKGTIGIRVPLAFRSILRKAACWVFLTGESYNLPEL